MTLFCRQDLGILYYSSPDKAYWIYKKYCNNINFFYDFTGDKDYNQL